MENLDWMSVVKVLLLAWKLRMQLSKKQEKTKKSRGGLFLLTMNSLAWSVRWKYSNLESTTKKKQQWVSSDRYIVSRKSSVRKLQGRKNVALVTTSRRSNSSTRRRRNGKFGKSNTSSLRRKKPQRRAAEAIV